ncbi:hypothetical protein KI387_039778, partial [Taxus chinensis]
MKMAKDMLKMKEVVFQNCDVHLLNVKSTIHHIKLLVEMIHSMELAEEREKYGKGPKVEIPEPNDTFWKATIESLVKEWNGCKSSFKIFIIMIKLIVFF